MTRIFPYQCSNYSYTNLDTINTHFPYINKPKYYNSIDQYNKPTLPRRYVRKTAAVSVAKLHDINSALVEDQGFLDMLRDLLSDSNPMVR